MSAVNPTPVGVAVALIGGKRACVWLAWALLATAVASVQSCRLNSEQSKGNACKTDVANFNATQTGNLATIKDLQHRLAVEATKRQMEASAHLAAAARLNEQIAAEAAKADLVQNELDRLYASNPGAREWGATGVDADVLAKLPGDH